MQTNEALVRTLVASGVLETPQLIEAFRAVDRADFVPRDNAAYAYEDFPLPIGAGQTISQPYTVAFMFELLAPKLGERVLDVGSGSGWTTALLANLVGPTGAVYGVEIVPELVQFGRTNVERYELGSVSIQHAGSTPGYPDLAPFDRILVSAGSNTLSTDLTEQLAASGVMCVPVTGALLRIEKAFDGTCSTERFPGFVFVPLQ